MKRLQTLALEQKEDARHGDATFPIQKYITSLKPDYPVVTTHWHEEAEFTLITEGDASYQIDLTSYAVEKDDLIFIPPLLLHSRTVCALPVRNLCVSHELSRWKCDRYLLHPLSDATDQ
jgi:hypothetical protein